MGTSWQASQGAEMERVRDLEANSKRDALAPGGCCDWQPQKATLSQSGGRALSEGPQGGSVPGLL